MRNKRIRVTLNIYNKAGEYKETQDTYRETKGICFVFTEAQEVFARQQYDDVIIEMSISYEWAINEFGVVARCKVTPITRTDWVTTHLYKVIKEMEKKTHDK